MTVPPAVFSAVKGLLRNNDIAEISIIDDAYQTIPTRAALSEDTLAQLVQRIQSWEHPTAEFTALNLAIESEADITDLVLQSIYPLRITSPEIQTWFTEFDNIQEQRRSVLRPLEGLLRTELECNVLTLSPLSPIDPAHLPQVIFIDYYLDPRDEVANSLQLAKNIGERITTSFAEHQKPFVILMSSKEALTDVMKSQFRDQAKFLGGMFYFIPKEKLKPDVTFLLRLAVLVRSLNDGRQIQEFVEAFERELNATSIKFTDKVRALSLEDYAYIQKLTLHGEGMPLGDYLLWLFGTYFAHLLFRTVHKQRRQLDAMRFDHIAESDSMPSAEFLDLYSNVVAEEVDELGIHPRAKPAAPEGELGPPDPHFGDVFLNDKKEVCMIITPECDLLYAPEEDADRKHQPEDTVFIIPGKLENMSPAKDEEDLVTLFFPLGGKTYQIKWQLKRVSSTPYGHLREYMEQGGFRRCARIRHPFATLVQTSFTSDLTRVAIPVAPPMLREVLVTVHCQDAAGNPETRHPSVPGIVYKDRKEGADHVHFKLQTAVQIVETAQYVLERTEQQLVIEPPGHSRTRLESYRTRLLDFLAGLDTHLELCQPFRIKPKGSYLFPGTPVQATRDATTLSQRLNTAPIVALIEEEDQNVEVQAPGGAPEVVEPAVPEQAAEAPATPEPGNGPPPQK
jgi:hypothetical protein